MIETANSGLVSPPEDVAALAANVRRLVADPTLAAELGANGRKYAEANYGWDRLIADWLRQGLEQLNERALKRSA